MSRTTFLLGGAALLGLGAPGFAQTAAPATAPATAPAAGASAAAAPAATAPAAAGAKVTAGAQVSDTSGGAVGTIESVQGDLAVLSTGTTKASLPVTSFAPGPKGLVISMTKAQLEAAAAGAKTEAAADIAQGAAVSDQAGAPVGTIESVEGEFATVATANSKAKLPKTAFAKGQNGLVIAMTAAQLDAAAKQAAGASASGGSAPAAGTAPTGGAAKAAEGGSAAKDEGSGAN